MHQDIYTITKQILQLVEEAEAYEFHKQTFLNSLDRLQEEYERGKHQYLEYQKLLKNLLGNRSKKEWCDYYEYQILSLLKKTEPLLAQIERVANEAKPPLLLTLKEKFGLGSQAHESSVKGIKEEKIQEEKTQQATYKKEERKEEPTLLAQMEAAGITTRKAETLPEKEKQGKIHAKIPATIPAKIPVKTNAPPGIRWPEEKRKEEENDRRETEEEKNKGEQGIWISQKIHAAEERGVALLRKLKAPLAMFGKKEKESMPELHLKPEEDAALRKLAENIDKINHEASPLQQKKVSPAIRYIDVKLKLFFIQLHSYIARRRTPEGVPAPDVDKMPSPWQAKKPQMTGMPEVKAAGKTKALGIKQVEYMKSMTAKLAGKPSPIPAPEVEDYQNKEARFTFSIEGIKRWYSAREKEQKRFISKDSSIPHSMQVEGLKKKMKEFEMEEVAETTAKKEIKSMRDLLERGKAFKIYEPSKIGVLANILMRRFTYSLIDMFPEFFKNVYTNLRFANIAILSNTYVNIMVLCTLVSSIAAFAFFGMYFLATNPLFIVLPKTIVMSVLAASVIFLIFYMYPIMKLHAREGDINTNLPFAINHISAVAGSGVPPTKMFTLLVESGEYGEISIEFSKIVEYIDLFGYDLLTAVKSVSLTTPSIMLKEFLEGIVSTVESGGDLKDYLKEKAESAMLNYELERQKYLENISTYSDIYTGILIAAPLFFVVALALISMLGGTIGGMEINSLILIGGYIIIPLLNILFIVFLEATQPAM